MNTTRSAASSAKCISWVTTIIVVPFIEPGTAGGATLTAVGLRWLIEHEGGKPADQPDALKVAKKHVRPEDEAARLPRAEVYGVSRGS